MLHSLWRQSVWQSVSGNTTWNVESETETSGGRWPLVSGFARWFFEFRGRGCEFGFETNVEILHVWRTRWSRRSIFVIQFSPFSFFVLRLRNLEANFKFQRRARRRKTKRLVNPSRRGLERMISHLLNLKDEKVTVATS